MASDAIKIYGRIKPLKHNRLNQYQLTVPSDPADLSNLHFHISKDEQWGLVNNTRENYDFKFNHVFNQETSQEEVFDVVAKDIVDNVLEGYNGTIFAYGQTGSGKTFTITGGVESYGDRGLIPRCIQYIFQKASQSTEKEFSISVSYLEIYNETGYDLLYQERQTAKLEDLPRVTLYEDGECVMIRNLSQYVAPTEEEALNLLFLGDTNKVIAETPSNPASSRSHCIFTINITSRDRGSSKVLRSKLNLVDLAGSERVAKTKIDGTILKEARYINLSLHFLEQVIIALHEKSIGTREHIPYRNSMMTSILRDSLGGNCKTSMIATLAIDQHLLFETISTCRFAQRVALIKNQAQINEETDLNLVIENLKREIERLKAELALARGGADYDGGQLPEYEKERVRRQVDDYLKNNLSELIFGDYKRINEAFAYLKESLLLGEVQIKSLDVAKDVIEDVASSDVSKLRQQVYQRDAEIAVLISMMNKQPEAEQICQSDTSKYENLIKTGLDFDQFTPTHDPMLPATKEESKQSTPIMVDNSNRKQVETVMISREHKMIYLKEFQQQVYKQRLSDLLKLRKQLKQKQEQAKRVSVEAKAVKEAVSSIKSQYERKQVEKMMMVSGAAAAGAGRDKKRVETDLMLIEYDLKAMRQEMELRRDEYKKMAEQLNELKRECDHLQRLVNAEKLKMTSEFDRWLREVKFKDHEILFEEDHDEANDEQEKVLSRHLPKPHLKQNPKIEETVSKLQDLEIKSEVLDFFRKFK